MPMGTKQVSVAHLKILIQQVPKIIHGLVYSDICPKDRQNFASFEKCMSTRTQNALHEFVPDSEATQFYLKLCSKIGTSLMDVDTIPHERIELIFHVVYFLRIWRKWMVCSDYVLSDNFITTNAYKCIELNAANLLTLIRKFRDENRPELFLTTLFDSQACERAFRQFRSMGTPNFTRINFTLWELLYMIRRYEVQNEIAYTKLSKLNIKLPKLEKCRSSTKIYELPTEDEITQCLKRAKRFALDDADNFKMHIDPKDIDTCDIPFPKLLDISASNSADDMVENDCENDTIENENNDMIENYCENENRNELENGQDDHEQR